MENVCAPRSRCRRWRVCPHCARARQARIADAAERLAARVGDLAWTILQPRDNSPASIAKARAAWLRSAQPAGAIWTVEAAPTTGRLHLNLIHPRTATATVSTCATWHEPHVRNVRAVAAYVSKRSQAPTTAAYPGRAFGTAGPLWLHLALQPHSLVAQAAMLQHLIDPIEPIVASALPIPPPPQRNPTVHQRALAAMRHYLPDLIQPASQSNERITRTGD